jgi:photosystem I subunit 11
VAQLIEKLERSNDNPNDPRNQEVVHAANDPQIGNLATPINSSGLVRAYIDNLPGRCCIKEGLRTGETW